MVTRSERSICNMRKKRTKDGFDSFLMHASERASEDAIVATPSMLIQYQRARCYGLGHNGYTLQIIPFPRRGGVRSWLLAIHWQLDTAAPLIGFVCMRARP